MLNTRSFASLRMTNILYCDTDSQTGIHIFFPCSQHWTPVFETVSQFAFYCHFESAAAVRNLKVLILLQRKISPGACPERSRRGRDDNKNRLQKKGKCSKRTNTEGRTTHGSAFFNFRKNNF